MAVRESRANQWDLSAPSFWTLIAAKAIQFPDPLSKMSRNVGILIRVYGPERERDRESPGLAVGFPRFPQGRPEITGKSLRVNGAFILDPNLG